MLFIERSLDSLDLAFDAANSVKKFLFFLNRVAHLVSPYTQGEYILFLQSSIGGAGIVRSPDPPAFHYRTTYCPVLFGAKTPLAKTLLGWLSR
jgi:hypothetical protein